MIKLAKRDKYAGDEYKDDQTRPGTDEPEGVTNKGDGAADTTDQVLSGGRIGIVNFTGVATGDKFQPIALLYPYHTMRRNLLAAVNAPESDDISQSDRLRACLADRDKAAGVESWAHATAENHVKAVTKNRGNAPGASALDQ